jgi:hypothetical protein
MSKEASIIVTPINGFILSDAQQGDMSYYVTDATQKISFGQSNTNAALIIDGANNQIMFNKRYVGINNPNPQYNLDIGGDLNVTGAIRQNNLAFSSASVNSYALTDTQIIDTSNTIFALQSCNINKAMCQWATTIDGAADEYGQGIAMDASNNVYVCGYFNSPACYFYNATPFGSNYSSNFQRYLTNLYAGGGTNSAYLCKYNQYGCNLWTARIDGNSNDYLYAVALDSNANIYVAGQTNSTNIYILNPDGTSSSNIAWSNANPATTCAIVAKFSTDGYNQWVTRIDSASNETTTNHTICCDNSNIYVSLSSTAANIPIYNASNILAFTQSNTAGIAAQIIVKYDLTGNFIWSTQISGGSVYPGGICTDPTGSLYICGYSSGQINFYNSNNTASYAFTMSYSNSYQWGYLAKYSSNGQALWGTKINSQGSAQYTDVTADFSNIYVTGYFTNRLYLMNSNHSITYNKDILFTNNQCGIIVKYDSNGVYKWSSLIEGDTLEYPTCIAIDSNNNIYTCGTSTSSNLTIINTATLLQACTLCNSTPSTYMSWITKHDSEGNNLWITKIDGSNANDYINGIACTNSNFTVTGYTNAASLPYTLNIYDSYKNQQGTLSNLKGSYYIYIAQYSVTEPYKLLANLGSNDTGTKKIIMSQSKVTQPVLIRNSNDTITQKALYVGDSNLTNLYWGGSNWYYINKPLVVQANGLYSFTDFTFTTAGGTGAFGPTLAQIQSAYSGTPWTQKTNALNMTQQGIQLWTVPATGIYNFAVGGSYTPNAYTAQSGFGRRIYSTLNLIQGQVLKILVGQFPTYALSVGAALYYAIGGGGGSFVVTNNNIPLIIAGGGGGGLYYNTSFYAGTNAPAYNATSGGSAFSSGGTNGYGATYGGGGFYTDGGTVNYAEGGKAFLNGGLGATKNGINGVSVTDSINSGGFGGGGGVVLNVSNYYNSGGGGGYSGGSIGNNGGGGGFGGSGGGNFITSAALSSSDGGLNVYGYITITPQFTIIGPKYF